LIEAAVHYVRLSSVPPEKWRQFEGTLPASARATIWRYRQARDRLSRIAGRWLLRCGLAAMASPSAWCFDDLRQNAFGRPFLPGLPNVDFNLSHSGDLVVCAVSTGCRVGIDVEAVRDIELSGFERVLADSTWAEVQQSAAPRKAFFRNWTRLESVAKAEGFGIAGPVREIGFDESSAHFQDRTWFLKELEFGAEYACHIALGSDCIQVPVFDQGRGVV